MIHRPANVRGRIWHAGLFIAVPVLVLVLTTPALGAEPAQQTFKVNADRVWAVTQAVLKTLGWDIDKDKTDRTIGVITTDSRRLGGEDYGVYAKGTRHRLRITVKGVSDDRATVTIERTVFKRERIVFVDKDEPVTATDQDVEKKILEEIRRAF